MYKEIDISPREKKRNKIKMPIDKESLVALRMIDGVEMARSYVPSVGGFRPSCLLGCCDRLAGRSVV